VADPGRPSHSPETLARGRALAERLKSERTRQFADLALEAFAHEAGVSPNTLKKVEKGQGSPGFFVVADLAAKLHVPLEELAGPRRGRRR